MDEKNQPACSLASGYQTIESVVQSLGEVNQLFGKVEYR